ncbi:MAG: cyclase family protein [Thermoguttaceae bacterium]|nr:cyclase family protein [Thermoguttaceae bacterium]
MDKTSNENEIIDLSHTVKEGMPVYPGDEIFRHQIVADHDIDGYRVSAFVLGSHLGTHLDFPFHAFVDGETCLDIPLDYFHGPAVVIDLTPFDSGSVPFIIDLDLLQPFRDIFYHAPRVLLRTGWSRYFGSREFYCGFPALTVEAASWLTGFPLMILGLESPSLSSLSPDNMPENSVQKLDVETLHADRMCHRILLGKRPPILPLECLAHLDRLPAFTLPSDSDANPNGLRIAPFSKTVDWDESKVFLLSCPPLAIEQADGSPVRPIAILP